MKFGTTLIRVVHIFGDSTGDSIADKILANLRISPEGFTQTEIIEEIFHKNKNAQEIGRALQLLQTHGLANQCSETSTGPCLHWWASCRRPGKHSGGRGPKIETLDKPHAKRRGWLKNGNKPGDPSKAPRCKSKSKRSGLRCKGPAMKNGNCRMHGGCSTGPKTQDGKQQIANAHLKTGRYSKKAIAERKLVRDLIRELKDVF